jgi:outer membrane protein OmpA-like peptidoglycan-associated protein
VARNRGRGVADVARYTGSSTMPPSLRPEPDDEQVTSGTTFALVALVVFLTIVFAAVRFGIQGIEGDIEARAGAALAANEYPNVQVDARGTVVTLSGTYLEPQQSAEEAVAIVGTVGGVSEVAGQIWPEARGDEDAVQRITGDPFEVQWTDGLLTVRGELSTPEKVDFVTSTLEPIVGGAISAIDTSGVGVKEGLEEEAWLGPLLGFVIVAIDQLPNGLIRADAANSYVAISAEVTDRDVRDDLNGRVEALAADFGFDPIPGVLSPRTGPTSEEVEELQESINELILDQVVEFEVTSFQLTAKGIALLDEVLAALRSAPEVRVVITGHTDDQGSATANQLLSEQRARAVLEYMVSAGEDPARFDIVGYGETRPVASNDTEDGRQKNRRIEFTALFTVAEETDQ